VRKWLTGLLALLPWTPHASADEIKLAIFPSNDPAKLHAVMRVLGDYLAARTGDAVTTVVTRDYAELQQRVRERSVDIAWVNTLNYVRLISDVPSARYLATYMERNETTGRITPYYQAYIVAPRSGGIADLDGIRGKRFAFTDRASTSGFAFPNHMLKSRGIDPERDFAHVVFLKRHDRVAEALLHGAVDAGAMSDGTYFTARRAHGDALRILAKSAPIPLDAIVASGSLDAAKAEAVKRALLEMPPDHPFCRAMREILGWNAAGFAVRDDGFYDSVRAVYAKP
jgi:phosphonate transport system substrate-binding protein